MVPNRIVKDSNEVLRILIEEISDGESVLDDIEEEQNDKLENGFDYNPKRREVKQSTLMELAKINTTDISKPILEKLENDTVEMVEQIEDITINSDQMEEKILEENEDINSEQMKDSSASLSKDTKNIKSNKDRDYIQENVDYVKDTERKIMLVPECVLNHKVMNDVRYYLIKWKDIPNFFNTWVPITSLGNHQQLLKEYFLTMPNQRIPPPTLSQKVCSMLGALKLLCTDEDIEKVLKKYRTTGGLNLPNSVNKFHITTQMERFLLLDENHVEKKSLLNIIRKLIVLDVILERRENQLMQLNLTEIKYNLIDSQREKILIENIVDLDVITTDFSYINKCIVFDPKIMISDNPIIGCSCQDCGSSLNCCPMIQDVHTAYNRNGQVILSKGHPIYECNSKCNCDETCTNRVTQRKPNFELCIFKTMNGCGWGVRTLKPIPSGTYVTSYLGEIITSEEANKRGKIDSIRCYLFDMDFNSAEHFKYTVDASKYGNIAHFINHSCDPNLTVYSVWVNCLDPDVHNLCLFTNRNIETGEELTFDYMTKLDDVNDAESQYMKCKCNSVKCKGFIF